MCCAMCRVYSGVLGKQHYSELLTTNTEQKHSW